MDVALWTWVAFAAGIGAVLLVDVAVFHRRAANVTVGQAAAWTIVWLLLAVAFAGVVWLWRGDTDATAYLAGYLIERSLSIDNVFVFGVILGYFAVPEESRHRALLCGVVGALVLRAGFIAGGAVALERFAWTIYVLGAFLILTGLRLARREVEVHPDRNVVLRLVRRIVPMSPRFHGHRFIVRAGGRRLATPMVAVLAAVATTDVAFAADSVPAIFAVTDDPFLVFAATAFSVMGMLALYFLLAGLVERFRYLRPALAAILILIGAKMAASGVVHVPVGLSLAVVVAVLATAAAASLAVERAPERPRRPRVGAFDRARGRPPATARTRPQVAAAASPDARPRRSVRR